MFEIVRRLFNFSKSKQELEILENKIKKLRNQEYDIRQTIEKTTKRTYIF